MKVRWKLPSATLWLLLLLHLALQPLGWSRAREGVASFGRASCCCDAAPAVSSREAVASRGSASPTPPGESAETGCCASGPGPLAPVKRGKPEEPVAPTAPGEQLPGPGGEDGCGCRVAPDRGPGAPEPLGLTAAQATPAAPRVAPAPREPAPLVEGGRLSRARRTGAAPPGAGPPLRILYERFLL